jgi:hypothetical protein
MTDWDTSDVMKAPPRQCEKCDGKGMIGREGRNSRCVACDGTGYYCPHGVRNWRQCAICNSA